MSINRITTNVCSLTLRISCASCDELTHRMSEPAIDRHDFKCNNLFGILMGVTGYSGKAAATALAPDSLVRCDNPTNISRPIVCQHWEQFVWILKIQSIVWINKIPVNKTSPPSRVAFGSAISMTGSLSSFLIIARIVSTFHYKHIHNTFITNLKLFGRLRTVWKLFIGNFKNKSLIDLLKHSKTITRDVLICGQSMGKYVFYSIDKIINYIIHIWFIVFITNFVCFGKVI